MHIFYQPRSRRAFAFRRGEKGLFDRLWNRRRYDHYEIEKILHYLLVIVFLWVMVHLGSSLFFIMYNPFGIQVASYCDGIDVPSVERPGALTYRRHCLVISVHTDKTVKFNGKIITEPWDEYLREKLQQDPMTIALLVIDKKCKMEDVYTVFNALRQAAVRYGRLGGGARVFFLTNVSTPL
ncbi:hypothetical protein AMJ80_12625 [bacterium SM23_31]|nr:MAG: hypothetical protein AMJ80_12625 [bacterium SM23_31]